MERLLIDEINKADKETTEMIGKIKDIDHYN